MHRIFAAIVLAFSAGLAAQNAAPDSANRIIVSGCIHRATASPVGTSGETAAATWEPKFLLTNTALNPESPPDHSASGTPSAATGTTYRLDADEAKLTTHVGEQVEITGVIDEPAATARPAELSATADEPSVHQPRLRVETVQTLAARCSK